jgi:hypothetical protein
MLYFNEHEMAEESRTLKSLRWEGLCMNRHSGVAEHQRPTDYRGPWSIPVEQRGKELLPTKCRQTSIHGTLMLPASYLAQGT